MSEENLYINRILSIGNGYFDQRIDVGNSRKIIEASDHNIGHVVHLLAIFYTFWR